jgi:Trypsin
MQHSQAGPPQFLLLYAIAAAFLLQECWQEQAGSAQSDEKQEASEAANADIQVYGGAKVSIATFPFTVGIHIGFDRSCGGAIISRRHILSAAHCLDIASFSQQLATLPDGLSATIPALGCITRKRKSGVDEVTIDQCGLVKSTAA